MTTQRVGKSDVTDDRQDTSWVGSIMRGRLRRAWWATALRGVAAILVGLVALTWPQLTLSILLLLLGSYLLVDGIFAIVAAFQASHQGHSWAPYLLEGLFSIVVGVLAFTRPATVALFVLLLVAFRSLITGFVTIATGVWLRRETRQSEWLMWLAGLASIAFGLILLARPALGVATLVWLVGVYTIAFGIIEIVAGFRLRSVTERLVHRTV